MIKILFIILLIVIIILLISVTVDYFLFKLKYTQLVLTGIEDLKEAINKNKNNINEE